ncbi:MAG: 16S rRNA (adenine(1518)-N(6)/adenine(1519)-N(6))-dimethyltransferase RsmA [Oscillospiraceae bacterium]|jgi:16S rRNA (adenine1518-N6/adenine1519-N6)-dimethyltransferase|nr:16S rRNA (adenine(1518)-N(6)/adenine(1519)-N(6))-dimethyltransferase RsmA [Oscillospiraceae bacterium]
MLTDLGVIKDLCKRYDFNFSKGLGQNFLTNPSVCPKMAEYARDKNVLEIGPGFGVLTEQLLKVAKKVVCVEVDTKLLPVLEETVPQAKIINDDILKTDINKLFAEEFEGDVVVCANLPYYITTPIITRFLENPNLAGHCELIFMIQKETAQRLSAKIPSREVGAITYAVNYYGKIKKLFDVSRGSFFPIPNVDSSVIQIIQDKQFDIPKETEKRLFEIIKKAFSQRRKQIGGVLGKELVNSCGISPNLRAENLNLEQFIQISEKSLTKPY